MINNLSACNNVRVFAQLGIWSIVSNPRTPMCAEPITFDNRRNTCVRIKVQITAQALTEPLTCEGETILVNLHGALISTATPLRVGMKIHIRVVLTDRRALAQVVYVDPDRPRLYGIGLEKLEKIWGVSRPRIGRTGTPEQERSGSRPRIASPIAPLRLCVEFFSKHGRNRPPR